MVDAESRIAYIRLTTISRNTFRDLGRALADLDRQGMKALILDLRFSPGGIITLGIKIADRFIEVGPIVSIKGRSLAKPIVLQGKKEGSHLNFPMV